VAWTLANALVSATAATLAVTNTNLGDIRAVGFVASSATATLTLSGGGVGTWDFFGAGFSPTNVAGYTMRLAWGVITATGAQTITAATTAGTIEEVVSGAFTPPAGTVAQDGAQGTATGTTTTAAYQSLTPSTASDLFWAYSIYPSAGAAGSTTGFTYFLTAASDIAVYSLAAPNPSAPTNPCNSGGWGSMDGLLEVSAGGVVYAPRGLIVPQARNRAGTF
jgi:hypothetical protein